jgi:hypothetical protein
LFYKNLADNKTQNNNGIPNINEIKEFWSNIWSNEVQFNNQAEWIPNLENEIPDINNPHHIQISLEILVKNINSSHNWKSPGGDQIHNFWLKKFTLFTTINAYLITLTDLLGNLTHFQSFWPMV